VNETHCPVCGFDLGFMPWEGTSSSDEICPSCGIQFGYDDAAGGDIVKRREIYREWRARWIMRGKEWSSVIPPPPGWDPDEQLKTLIP
jgi:hypothetical protein